MFSKKVKEFVNKAIESRKQEMNNLKALLKILGQERVWEKFLL